MVNHKKVFSYLNLKMDKKEYNKLYKEKNRERLITYAKEYNRKYYELNKEKIKEQSKVYSKTHRNQINHYVRFVKPLESIIKNKEYKKQWKKQNQAKLNAREKERRKNDIAYKILYSLRNRLVKAVTKKFRGEKTREILGCDIPYLLKYLESQFDDEMSWTNYGKCGWHIDHKIPCYFFDLTDTSQQKKCFHYTNLQLLWAIDNLTKNRFYGVGSY